MIKKTPVFFILFIFLSVTTSFAAQASLYSNLVKDENGRYTITEITSYKNAVDLKDLSPVGFDTSVIDCSVAFFGASKFNDNAGKCQPNKEEFRTKKVKLGPTLLLGLTTFGISLLFGVVKVESVFDYYSFDKAVHEALLNSGPSMNRAVFVDRFNRISNLAKLYDKELDLLYRQYADEYRSSSPGIKEKKIADLSGYYNSEDLYVEILVKVNKRKVSDLRPEPYQLPAFSASPSEFEEKIAEYEKDLKAAFVEDKAAFEKSFKAATSTFDVKCGPDYIKPYHLKYECPQTISSSEAEYSARVFVLSKDFEGVFPVYTDENNDLKVTFTKNRVLYENKTKSPMKIRSVTVRYNGKNSTFNADDRAGNYELLAMTGSDTLMDVRKIISYDMEKSADYKEVTKDKAKGTKVTFGMDIKYTLGDEGVEHTLSGDREYTLAELL